jgi:hypothetical protein
LQLAVLVSVIVLMAQTFVIQLLINDRLYVIQWDATVIKIMIAIRAFVMQSSVYQIAQSIIK